MKKLNAKPAAKTANAKKKPATDRADSAMLLDSIQLCNSDDDGESGEDHNNNMNN